MMKRLLLAFSTSLLLILTVPRWGIGLLAPLALLPLLLALRGETSIRNRAILGLAAGIPYWFFVNIWIEHVLSVHGGLAPWLAWFSFVLFSFLKSLHLALFSVLAGYLLKSPFSPPLIAALWTGIERTHGTFGFAWHALGNAGIDTPWLLGLPAITGVYGLSFLFALSAAAAARATATKSLKPLAWLAAFAIPFFVLPPVPEAPTEYAMVVQPMMPQASEWTRELLDQRLKGLAELSMQPSAAPLLIWPEMPGPLYFDSDPAFHELAVTLAQARKRYFLFGTVTRAPSGAPLNTAMMLSPTGAEVGRYNKVNLVPFGEFVPSAFAWVNRITQEAGDFEPGTQLTTFRSNGSNAGVFICYESAFPEFVRQFAREGATYFVNISNDGYFGESKAREQHLSLVRMRAVENRRWIIRATNSGITAVIDPLGRVVDTLPEYQHTAKVVKYGIRTEVTPYSRYGDWFAWTCLALAGLACALSIAAPGSRVSIWITRGL